MRRGKSYLGGHTLVPWSWFVKTKYSKRRLPPEQASAQQASTDKVKNDPERNKLVSAWALARGERKRRLFNIILKYDRHRRRSQPV